MRFCTAASVPPGGSWLGKTKLDCGRQRLIFFEINRARVLATNQEYPGLVGSVYVKVGGVAVKPQGGTGPSPRLKRKAFGQ